jgi:hypothetical protein
MATPTPLATVAWMMAMLAQPAAAAATKASKKTTHPFTAKDPAVSCGLANMSAPLTFLLGYCLYQVERSVKAYLHCELMCQAGHCSHYLHTDTGCPASVSSANDDHNNFPKTSTRSPCYLRPFTKMAATSSLHCSSLLTLVRLVLLVVSSALVALCLDRLAGVY